MAMIIGVMILAAACPAGSAPVIAVPDTRWGSRPLKCDFISPDGWGSTDFQMGVSQTRYSCREWSEPGNNVHCTGQPGGMLSAWADYNTEHRDWPTTSRGAYAGQGSETKAVPIGIKVTSQWQGIETGADTPTNAWGAAAELLNMAVGQEGVEIAATKFQKYYTCAKGDGQWVPRSQQVMWEYREAVEFECRNFKISMVGGIYPHQQIGGAWGCTANGNPGTTPDPPVPVISYVGSNYEGPGYICDLNGADGTFFTTVRHLDFNYPVDPNGQKAWRQVTPGGDPGHVWLWEAGVPLSVSVGSVCDARHDPYWPGRASRAGFGDLVPVEPGFTGTGVVCNPSGTYGVRGETRQAFLPTYVAQVSPWNSTSMAMMYAGLAWVVPRADVCRP